MSTRVLDHLLHFTPPGSVESISAEYRQLGFDVTPGGTHADGLTYNALISLADGVYIELIAFVRAPPPPPAHRWAAAPPGWLAAVHLARAPDVDRTINARAARDGSGVAYRPAAAGGRGALQWRITAPQDGAAHMPFFCADVTPRALRVPEPGRHASTARGVAHVKFVAAGRGEYAAMAAQMTTVLGVPPSAATATATTWPLETPTPLPGLHAELILELVGDDDASQESGMSEVGFWVDKGRGGRADTQYGSIVWKPVP